MSTKSDEIWVMIKANGWWSRMMGKRLAMRLIRNVENSGMAQSDGMSIGINSIDLNFCEISDFVKCKDLIEDITKGWRKNGNCIVSDEYDCSFDV